MKEKRSPERLQHVKKKDFLIIAGILTVALGIFASFRPGGNQSLYAEIYYNGNPVKTVYLDEPQVFSVDAVPQVTFEVKNGSIAFIRSNCPDQICVRAGWLNKPGQFAACLPNKLTLWVKAYNGGGVDVIVH